MKRQHLGIEIDTDRDSSISEQAMTLLKNFYMRPDETSPQEAYARPAVAYCAGDMALAQRIYDYVSLGWAMYASPVLSNAPLPGEKVVNLPISCFLMYVPDTVQGLIDHTEELRWLSVKGGGLGGHWSDVRSVSDKAPGPIPFIHTVDGDMTAYRQGRTRRGNYAAYMDVGHPDILEFVTMRVPTGDVNRKNLNLHHGVNVSDDFMRAVQKNGDWPLVDPKDGTVRETLKARDLWQQLIETRFRTGEPYLAFIDTANRSMHPAQKAAGLKIRGSNLCNEIWEATDEQRTGVCCLSSLNLEWYFGWRDTTIVEDFVTFLDNVLDGFIGAAKDMPGFERAVYSARQERSLGLGAMGLHSLYQMRGIPFDSDEADVLNEEIFDLVEKKANQRSVALAAERGACPDIAAYPELPQRRNVHLLAIAPNSNSGTIAGTSPSIEPWAANVFAHKTRAGSALNKNKFLERVLAEKGLNTREVWNEIIDKDGSVAHMKELTPLQKRVFATAREIDQRAIVRQAARRQEFLCQGQSLNVFYGAGASKKVVSDLHFQAWDSGCKGLYYLRAESSGKAEKIGERVERVALRDGDQKNEETECISCQG